MYHIYDTGEADVAAVLLEIAQHEVPAERLLESTEGMRAAARRAAEWVREARVNPATCGKVRSTLVVGPDGVTTAEGAYRPKYFRPEWADDHFPYRELCTRWPLCAHQTEPFQHPATKPKVVLMCETCRKSEGPSGHARRVLAENNRKRRRNRDAPVTAY